MGLKFNLSMDPKSLDVYRGNMLIGMLQWHPERPHRFVPASDVIFIDICDMEAIVEKMKEIQLSLRVKSFLDREDAKK